MKRSSIERTILKINLNNKRSMVSKLSKRSSKSHRCYCLGKGQLQQSERKSRKLLR